MSYADKVILVITVMAPWLGVIGGTFAVVAYIERRRK